MRYFYGLLLFIAWALSYEELGAQGNKNTLNPDFVYSVSNFNNKDVLIQDNGGLAFPLALGYSSFIPMESHDLPSYYDLRDMGLVAPIETQSAGGCWAYSSMSTLESRILFLGGEAKDFSDNNLKYCHGFLPERSTNGNAWMTTAYFARQSGPLLEEQDPHPGGTSEPGVNCPIGETPAVFVRDSRYPFGDMMTIKQLIMEVGSIWSLIYYNADYFNDQDNTYFYGGSHPVNHVFNVLGWDDTRMTEGGVGAWICQNTYGASWGEGGFVYVSYHDTQLLLYNAYYPNIEPYSENSRVLSYDELGNYNSYGYESETGYALVKYPIYENLLIEELGTYAMAYGTEFSMEIYGAFNEETGVLNDLLGQMTDRIASHPGYYTFHLDQAIPVYSGQEIYVKIKYTTPAYEWPIPIEEFIESYADPYIETGVSWVSASGEAGSWELIGGDTESNFDLCVKVYGQVNPMALPLSNHLIFILFGLLVIVSWLKRN